MRLGISELQDTKLPLTPRLYITWIPDTPPHTHTHLLHQLHCGGDDNGARALGNGGGLACCCVLTAKRLHVVW